MSTTGEASASTLRPGTTPRLTYSPSMRSTRRSMAGEPRQVRGTTEDLAFARSCFLSANKFADLVDRGAEQARDARLGQVEHQADFFEAHVFRVVKSYHEPFA